MAGALDHLMILDLTSHLSGPYCAMLLADHGADVIKIEPPTAIPPVACRPSSTARAPHS
jgi:crotonobetainyl-CoA:carnitine CoA-transferase CaiB-like acyl-CoA transferase